MKLARKKQHGNEIFHKTKRAFLCVENSDRLDTLGKYDENFFSAVCALHQNCDVRLLTIVARAF